MSRASAFRAVRAVAGLLVLLVSVACGNGAEPPGGAVPGVRAAEPSPIRFRNVSREAGLTVTQIGGGDDVDHIIESIGIGGAWLDYDEDGDPDLYLAQGATLGAPRHGPPDVLLRNDGDPDGDGIPRFTDVTAESGVDDRLWSFGVATADYDNDGDTDIYVLNWGPNRLFRNNGDGTFTDVAEAAGLADPRWGTGAVWGDTDRDGDLDLYIANYVVFDFDRYPTRGENSTEGKPCMWKNIEVYCGPRNLEAEHDAFYRNEGDSDGDGIPNFVDVTDEIGLGIETPLFALSAHFFDPDDDGDDDLYVANDSVQNTFFVNRGDGTFEEFSIFTGVAYNEEGSEQAGMGIASGDYDGDGLLDLIVTNFSHDHDTLYHNDGNDLFTDVSFPTGIGEPSFLTLGWGVRFIDFDHDGWEDLFVAHGHVYPQVNGRDLGTSFEQMNALFRNRGNGTFEDAAGSAGDGLRIVKSSRAVLPVDIDADGDLDLLVTNYNDTPDLLLNEAGGRNWLQVRLEGTGSNRDGIGARVTIVADGRSQVREVRRNTSYGSALPIVHFGLGDSPRVESLEVRWPSGVTTHLTEIESNRLVTIREGTGVAEPSKDLLRPKETSD